MYSLRCEKKYKRLLKIQFNYKVAHDVLVVPVAVVDTKKAHNFKFTFNNVAMVELHFWLLSRCHGTVTKYVCGRLHVSLPEV